MLGFEFHQLKSEANLAKHGIDFLEGQCLWRDSHILAIDIQRGDDELHELRTIWIAHYGEKYWSAITTWRDGRHRIISIRRSRDEEIKLYKYSN